jgi:hypothetical protein
MNLQFVIDALKFRGYRRACLRPTCFFFIERVGCYVPKHFGDLSANPSSQTARFNCAKVEYSNFAPALTGN